jgi:dienelactone hydrolase
MFVILVIGKDHFMMKRLPVFLQSGVCLFLAFQAMAQATPRESVQASIESQSFDELLRQDQVLENASDLESASAALWEKYRKAVTSDGARLEEQNSRQIKYGDKTMRFSLSKKGDKPANGYPLYIALHGGGGAPPYVNDSQWEHMKIYYLDSVDTGVYVATRGVTDTWNLHFVDESYALYDHLIENLVAFENVDPNRVYIMGFSAGGDGVYQITPRMADRWAAANMSAGHHNWIRFDNLYNTPFLMQMGQFDSAYNRNTVAVENHIALNQLQAERGGYVHELFLHERGSHNSWRDNDASRREQTIVANPEAWLKGEPTSSLRKNTNAVDWLNQYTRNPYPEKIYWDPQTSAPRVTNLGSRYLTDPALEALLTEPKELFYWLDLAPQAGEWASGVMEASFDSAKNSVQIVPGDSLDGLRILIHQDMLDIQQPVLVYVGDELIGSVKVQPNLRTLTRTLLERGDREFIFHGEIEVKRTAEGQWTVQ